VCLSFFFFFFFFFFSPCRFFLQFSPWPLPNTGRNCLLHSSVHPLPLGDSLPPRRAALLYFPAAGSVFFSCVHTPKTAYGSFFYPPLLILLVSTSLLTPRDFLSLFHYLAAALAWKLSFQKILILHILSSLFLLIWYPPRCFESRPNGKSVLNQIISFSFLFVDLPCVT